MRTMIVVAALALALSGCDLGSPPAEKIKDAAEGLVETIDGAQPPQLGEGLYAPRDECSNIPGSDAFRQKLAAAVVARDADGLVALAASDVKLDFGGGSGAEELHKRLSDEDGILWVKLDTLLTMGCGANEEGGLTLPWVFTQDIDDIDPMRGMLVMGERVPMRAAPGDVGEPVRILSWDAVEVTGGLQPNQAYQKVSLPDGTTGYVATEMLRSLIDYRLIASSRDGKWSFTTLVAGD